MDKRKLIGSFALASAIGFGAMFGGSGDEPVMGSYRGGYYGQAGSYQGGTIAAEWETLTILFTFEPDTTTAINAHSEFLTAMRNADQVVDLSVTANGFAFTNVDKALPDAQAITIDGSARFRTRVSTSSSTDRWLVDSTGRIPELFYIPFEDYIPDNSQIVTAKIKRRLGDLWSWDNADTVSATLMTAVGDSAWMKPVGLTNPAQTRHAYSTWNFQRAGLVTNGYPASNGPAWSPPLADRDRFWDWGAFSDFTGRSDGSSNPQFAEVDFTIKNCVQAAVNGAVNNGIALNFSNWGTTLTKYDLFSWEAVGLTGTLAEENRPWVEVVYLTKVYRAPWPGGKDWAICLQTDDGNYKINKVYSDTLREYGGKFTMYSVSSAPDSGVISPEYYGWAEITADHTAGVMEFGSHSVWHNPGVGISRYGALIDNDSEYTQGMYPTALTGAATSWDSLMYDIDSEWIFYQVDLAGYGDWRGKPYFGESFGLPVSNHSPDSQIALLRQGYSAVRTLQVDRSVYDINDNLDERRKASFAPGRADTTFAGIRPADQTGPRNMRFMANSFATNEIVGDTTSTPSLAEVDYNIRNMIEKSRANGRGLVSFLVHDVKTNQNGQYLLGVSPEEFGQMVRTSVELDPAWMFVTEVTNWFADHSDAIATPAAFAQPDSFKFTAGDDIWGIPYGLNGTFIPELR